jgi:rhodanese-related sulfurtransferase
MKKSSLRFTGILFLMALFVSCGSEGSNFIKSTFGEYISAMELKYMIDHKEAYKLIDLRSPGAFSTGHIETAKNIPHTSANTLMYFINDPYLIILYSNEDIIQKNIYLSLRKSGATNIVMLSGGMYSWSYGFVTE